MPCHLLFFPQQVIVAAKRVGTLKEEEADQSPPCYQSLFHLPRRHSKQKSTITYQLCRQSDLGPLPCRCLLISGVCVGGSGPYRSCMRIWNPRPSIPNPSIQVWTENFTHSALQMNTCHLDLRTNRGLNINANSLARSRYISAGVYLISAFCLILLSYLWVLRSDCWYRHVRRSPSHQESSAWLHLEGTTLYHSTFILKMIEICSCNTTSRWCKD